MMKSNLILLTLLIFSSFQPVKSQTKWWHIDSLNIKIELDSIKSDISRYDSFNKEADNSFQIIERCPNLIMLDNFDEYLIIKDCNTLKTNMCYPSKIIVFNLSNLLFSESASCVRMNDFVSARYEIYSFDESMPDEICFKLIGLRHAQPQITLQIM